MTFEEVHARYHERVSALVRGRHIPSVAQELVRQEIWIAINTAITVGTFPTLPAHRDNYVISVVVSKRAGYFRSKKRAEQRKKIFVLASDVAELSLDREVWDPHRDESWEVLSDLLPSLPVKYREIVDLRLQDKSFAEISSILGISENLANVRHFRAIEKLREAHSRRLAVA
jgi:RNA polymerase sigma factor (sigma-70 family)